MKITLPFVFFLFFIDYSYSAPLKSERFIEYVNKKVKVSGSFHAGLQLNATTHENKLFVLIPKHELNMLCIEITSIDGIYKAFINYNLLPNSKPIFSEVEFNSKYKDELINYKPIELAINAKIGNECDSISNKLIISSWGNPQIKSDLALLIRSDARRDIAHIFDNKSNSKKVKCNKIDSGYNIAYDKLCLFKDIQPMTIKNIEVERKNLRNIPTERFEIK